MKELLEDSEWVNELKRRGIDMVNKKTSEQGENGGLDISYFI